MQRLFLISLLFAFLCQMVSSETFSTGIEGTVFISPIHGGPTRQSIPDSAPLANTSFLIENAAGTVIIFNTDDQGKFRVPLSPGHYSVRLESKVKIGGCGPFAVEVSTEGFKKVQWNCDSGMR